MAYKRRLQCRDTFVVTRKIGKNSSDSFFHSFKARKVGHPARKMGHTPISCWPRWCGGCSRRGRRTPCLSEQVSKSVDQIPVLRAEANLAEVFTANLKPEYRFTSATSRPKQHIE